MSAAAQAIQKRVLIIDDDPSVLKLLTSALERKSIASSTSVNGAGALAALQTAQFDVILLDLGLPDVNGLELVHSIREVMPAARIVIITGDTTSETLLRAIR